MAHLFKNAGFRVGCLILCLVLPKAVLSEQWYVGVGITDLSLSVGDSSISFDAINSLTGAQADDSNIDVRPGSAIPTLTIGRLFGEDSQWLVETTLSTGFEETFYAGGQQFASADLLPVLVLGAWQARKYPLGSGSMTIRPVLGGGVVYAYHRDPELSPSQLSTGQSAGLGVSSSFGLAALAGVNINLQPKTSIVIGFTYLDGLQADVDIENLDLPLPFVTAQSKVSLGGVQLDGLLTTARFQYQF